MAKGKPNLAFLEALRQDKRRRGDSSPGGVFKTPEWFNKTAATSAQSQDKAPAALAPTTIAVAPRGGSRLTRTHIAAGALVVCMVVVAGYITFRKPPAPKLSASIEAVRSAPIQGSVMDVPAGRAAVAPPAPIPVSSSIASPSANAAPQSPTAAAIAATGGRTAGMNYVVFQSYKDEKTATEAKDALIAGGIGATVETRHPYAPTWYVVIGTQGFLKTNAADYLQYVNKGRTISEKFAGKNKWKQFEPNAYKWR